MFLECKTPPCCRSSITRYHFVQLFYSSQRQLVYLCTLSPQSITRTLTTDEVPPISFFRRHYSTVPYTKLTTLPRWVYFSGLFGDVLLPCRVCSSDSTLMNHTNRCLNSTHLFLLSHPYLQSLYWCPISRNLHHNLKDSIKISCHPSKHIQTSSLHCVRLHVKPYQ